MDPDEPLPNNIYDACHQKFSRLSQIDQNLNRAIREIYQLQNPNLIAEIEAVREAYEDAKFGMHEFLQSISPEPIPLTFDVSQMEQAFSELSTTEDEDEDLRKLRFEILLENLEIVSKKAEGIDSAINDLMVQLQSYVPRKAYLVPQKKRKANLENVADPVPVNRNTENLMVQMYGLDRNEVANVIKSLKNRKIINSVSFQQEGAGALNWGTIQNLREKFEALKKRIADETEVERDSQKGSEGMMPMPEGAVAGYRFDARLEILKVVKNWLFHLESNFCVLVHDLRDMMSGHQAAAAKFQEFKSQLEALESFNPGMVSIAVYKVLAMKEIPQGQDWEDSVRRSVQTLGPGTSWAAITDKGPLYERIKFDEMIDSLLEIIVKLRGALFTSGHFRAEPQNIYSEVLDSYEEVFEQVQEAMEEIEQKMLWAKYEPIKLSNPAGKGKMKMN